MTKFFMLPNLATDAVSVIERPWEVRVPSDVLALPSDKYKARWTNPQTKHWLLLLVEGRNPERAVSPVNPAAAIHGFSADYDGVFTPDIVSDLKDGRTKPPSRFKPAWWSLSHGNKLHLYWLFDRPITVMNTLHASLLLHEIAIKIKAPLWGVGYDPSCEKPTQVIDIGREWHPFFDGARISAEEVIAWDSKLFQREFRRMVEERVDVPLEKVADEIKKREWPVRPPDTIVEGTRCARFWDPDADNPTGAQFTRAGLRVYTPHDNGFKSWRSLLGDEFCDQYAAKSLAPFTEDTYYFPAKDCFWRFLRNAENPVFEPRSERVLKRDLKVEAMVSDKPPKGTDRSEMDLLLHEITQRNSVQFVAPLLFEKAGRQWNEQLNGMVLNTSLVTLKAPAKPAPVTDETLAEFPDADPVYKEDPFRAKWDNPFAVREFPHIHKLLTCMFAVSAFTYSKWIAAGAKASTVSKVHDVQLTYLLSWMAHFYNSSTRRMKGRGQALVLAGETKKGKTFFAQYLLGGLMGGAVDASKFYVDNDRFTAGSVEVPVHLIDDRLGTLNRRNRIGFTERLKCAVANSTVRYEAKFGSAVAGLPWPGRVVILSNVDAQSLSVIPDLEMSTEDKFMMLKLSNAQFEWGSFAENAKWLNEELPHFARFLRMWEIPPEMHDARFGVRALQHPDLRRASAENGVSFIISDSIMDRIQAETALRDPKDGADATGWAFKGTLQKLYRWITDADPSLVREFDRTELRQSLETFRANGAYNIEFDDATREWRIAYDFRKTQVTT